MLMTVADFQSVRDANSHISPWLDQPPLRVSDGGLLHDPFHKLPSGLPLVHSHSAAVSAVCAFAPHCTESIYSAAVSTVNLFHLIMLN